MRRSGPRPAGFICHLCAPKQLSPLPFALRGILPDSHPRARPLSNTASQRWLSSSSSSSSTATATASASTTSSSSSSSSSPASTSTTTSTTNNNNIAAAHLDPLSLASIAEDSAAKFLSVDGIPPTQLTSAALQSCLRAATSLHPHLKRAEAQSLASASASRLVQLGAQRTGITSSITSITSSTGSTGNSSSSSSSSGSSSSSNSSSIPSPLAAAAARISRAAYAIVAHDNVHLDPAVLDLYVRIHAQLRRPESLPHVLELYAHKRRPVVPSSSSSSPGRHVAAVTYAPQNPNAAARAVEPAVAEAALQAAIDARHLDAALGVIEAAYCAPAFRRQKLIKHASAPALAIASLPFGIFGLGSAYAAYWQNTMDMATATGIGVAGISGYLFVVGSLGLIAKLSNKDQMKRVTWTPGTPLRYRWLREDERAALDKVACAWGFREPWRHGEETGPEWEGLKEYMGYRGMLLDRVEFMEGMN